MKSARSRVRIVRARRQNKRSKKILLWLTRLSLTEKSRILRHRPGWNGPNTILNHLTGQPPRTDRTTREPQNQQNTRGRVRGHVLAGGVTQPWPQTVQTVTASPDLAAVATKEADWSFPPGVPAALSPWKSADRLLQCTGSSPEICRGIRPGRAIDSVHKESLSTFVSRSSHVPYGCLERAAGYLARINRLPRKGRSCAAVRQARSRDRRRMLGKLPPLGSEAAAAEMSSAVPEPSAVPRE